MTTKPSELGPPRWRGQPHRLEVWYATLTDPRTTDGYWLHHEVVAPDEGAAYAHGWCAVFPFDGPARVERFGPAAPDPGGDAWFSAAGAYVDGEALRGAAGDLTWDLTYADTSPPLYTFPSWSWEKEVLPASQVVPFPTARFTGTVSVGGRDVRVDDAIGAVARIYGHGNAERWGWLHADLGGGDVLEVVAGAPRKRGPVAIPPVPLVQLRLDGDDWPADSVKAAARARAKVALPHWSVKVVSGRRRLLVDVTVPADASVALRYTDPDGAIATCTNSERADAEIVLQQWDDGWRDDRRWSLRGTAHAEVGTRSSGS
jgi:hypothetical protein